MPNEVAKVIAPMTLYEMCALILSGIAILIPLIQWAWKKWIVKPVLKYHPIGRAYLYCNMSGSYCRMDGVFEALHKPITVKDVSIQFIRHIDDKKLNLEWSTFISPVNQRFNGSYASSVETAHAFRVEADSVMCAFIEFGDAYDAAGKMLRPYAEELILLANSYISKSTTYDDALNDYVNSQQYKAMEKALESVFYWEIGKYTVSFIAKHGNKPQVLKYEFSVSAADNATLNTNMQMVLLGEVDIMV